jgi:glycine dehydrogenase
LPPAETEHEYLDRLRTVAAKNQRFRSFIGMGYYGTITPSVIFETSSKTRRGTRPTHRYQAEIAQGRLESLLNFQTMVRDLTAMDIATASLLDEATAAGRSDDAAASRAGHASRRRTKRVWVSERTYPQVLDVLKGAPNRWASTSSLAIRLRRPSADDVFGAYRAIAETTMARWSTCARYRACARSPRLVAVGSDLLALTSQTAPAKWARTSWSAAPSG